MYGTKERYFSVYEISKKGKIVSFKGAWTEVTGEVGNIIVFQVMIEDFRPVWREMLQGLPADQNLANDMMKEVARAPTKWEVRKSFLYKKEILFHSNKLKKTHWPILDA